MGLPLRDYRFATPVEKEHDRAYLAAMNAMRDPSTDEAQMLGEHACDDMSDLVELLCLATHTDDLCDLGRRLQVLAKKHADDVAEAEAEMACATIPSDPHDMYGVSRGDFS